MQAGNSFFRLLFDLRNTLRTAQERVFTFFFGNFRLTFVRSGGILYARKQVSLGNIICIGLSFELIVLCVVARG